MHTVVPAVLAVAGVLNGALVTAEELGKFPDSWNGRPIPILHPEQNGEAISANYPDVLERVVGTVLNARMDGDRLRAELWLDETQFDALGETALLSAMSEGQMLEVSTGYYADTLVQSGTFNGKPYRVKHENIRPDHLALLPGQTGACSIADGCGAPRVNAENVEKGKIATAVSAFLVTLGLKPNDCNCEVQTMKAAELAALAKKLVANGADLGEITTNFDLGELEKMSDVTRAALGAALKQLEKTQAAAAAAEDEAKQAKAAKAAADGTDDKEAEAMKKNAANGGTGDDAPVTVGVLKAMLGQAVADAMKPETINAMVERQATISRLVANEACAFTADELTTMSDDALAKYEKSIRPVDYSGAAPGSFVQNNEAGGSPLMVHSGLMSEQKTDTKTQ